MIRYYSPSPLTRSTDGASGYDLRARLGTPRTVEVGRRWVFSTGLHVAMPEGVEAQVRSRSGLVAHHGLWVPTGTIDSDYRGEIRVTVFNHGEAPYEVQPDERIAQLVFSPVLPDFLDYLDAVMAMAITGESVETMLVRVDSREELGDTARGSSGFGSTGR